MSEDQMILMHILRCSFFDLVTHKPVLTQTQQEQFAVYRARRDRNEPLQYILGSCDFIGLELAVNKAVLIPRPETEQLVDVALRTFKGGWALDLGTGSGNIAIALAKHLPEARIISVDISNEALVVARANADRHGVSCQIQFVEGDILDLKADVLIEFSQEKRFDLIIANPPYIPTDALKRLPLDVQEEPRMALDGGCDGLRFYRQIIKNTPPLLRRGACLMMEFGDGQGEAIQMLIEHQGGFRDIALLQDLAGKDRMIKAYRET